MQRWRADDADLRPQTVADFLRGSNGGAAGLGIDVKIWTMPVEVPSPFSAVREAIPFEQDQISQSYDAGHVNRFWRALVSTDDAQTIPRFIGRVSPVHFWWGSFDHAVSASLDARAAARRRRQNYRRSVFTRSHQPWLLARPTASRPRRFQARRTQNPALQTRAKTEAAFYSKRIWLPAVRRRSQAGLPHLKIY